MTAAESGIQALDHVAVEYDTSGATP